MILLWEISKASVSCSWWLQKNKAIVMSLAVSPLLHLATDVELFEIGSSSDRTCSPLGIEDLEEEKGDDTTSAERSESISSFC